MLPTLFVSHGAPTLPLTNAPARDFLGALGRSLPERPKAILAVSAHWETPEPVVSAPAINETIHDFRGFPEALYRIRYPAPPAPELAERARELICAGGIACTVDRARGLDHGAWVPLSLMFPEADIAVAQLAVQPQLGPAHHLRIGELLAPLRSRGVLILGSGSFTHDLSSIGSLAGTEQDEEPDWVADFADWFGAALAAGRMEDLIDYRRQAPHARRNHPTEEHLLPLFTALGAGMGNATLLHSSRTHSVLRMDVYAFGTGGQLPIDDAEPAGRALQLG